jgi:DNA-binding NtrC family response regulator
MQKKILIIDDDVELCQEVNEILHDEGFFVTICHDPLQCDELIKNDTFDIALVDFKIPGSTGMELVKKIKQKSPATKAFILSGKPFIEKLLEEQGHSSIIDGVMNKPFDIEKLLQSLKSL